MRGRTAISREEAMSRKVSISFEVSGDSSIDDLQKFTDRLRTEAATELVLNGDVVASVEEPCEHCNGVGSIADGGIQCNRCRGLGTQEGEL